MIEMSKHQFTDSKSAYMCLLFPRLFHIYLISPKMKIIAICVAVLVLVMCQVIKKSTLNVFYY